MKKIHYHVIQLQNSDKAFFIKRNNININKFLKYFGIKKHTFMELVINDLFFNLFGNSINLYKEYRKFYKKEYPTFNDYLQQKHNLLPKEAKLFQNKNSYYKEINKYYMDEIFNAVSEIKCVLEKYIGKIYY